MNLYLIKIFGIILVTICCIIAAYTDVKCQIIPNKLTFTTLILGIILVSVYFAFKEFNPLYYLSIVVVYLFSYFLWRIGLWAGGDVKLFTAISSLFIPEFLNVLPGYVLFGISFPYRLLSLRIPTFMLMFNSILSIIPIVLIYVVVIILKDKPYLKERFKKSINFKEVFLSLNSVIIAYTIISKLNVYHPLLKILFLLILSYPIIKMLKYDLLLIIFTITIIIQQILIGNITLYMMEFGIIFVTLTVKNIYKNRIIKDALTKKVKADNLEEGMILQYPLYYKNQQYYFDKSSWYDFSQKGELICSNNARGITDNELQILKETCPKTTISIKRGLSFAPFILSGLIITLFFGNTYQLFFYLGGLVW